MPVRFGLKQSVLVQKKIKWSNLYSNKTKHRSGAAFLLFTCLLILLNSLSSKKCGSSGDDATMAKDLGGQLKWQRHGGSVPAHVQRYRQRQLAAWESMSAPSPIGIQEGSGVRVRYTSAVDGKIRNEVWFGGGYPVHKGMVSVLDLDSETWRIPPGQQLPTALHHVLQSMFFHEESKSIIILGGLSTDGTRNLPNHGAYVLKLEQEDPSWEWVELPGVGGIISCSTMQLDGKFWCYSGSSEYVSVEFKFFTFDLSSIAVSFHPGPIHGTTHVGLMVDDKNKLVYMSGGRKNHNSTINKLFTFDIESNQWLDEIDFPYVPLESRMVIQTPGSRVGLYIGGQASEIGQRVTSDIILQFNFDTKEILWVDELPETLFGQALVDLWDGRYMLHGGGTNVGPTFTRATWIWRPDIDIIEQPIQPSSNLLYTGSSLKIIDARCGSIVVTQALIQHVSNMSAYRAHMEPLIVPADWCESPGMSEGNPTVVQALSIDFFRDEMFHRIVCTQVNSCLLVP